MFQFTDFFQVRHNQYSAFMPHSLGMEICKNDHTIEPRYRNYYLIHYVISGQGTLDINQTSYEISEHTAFLIPAGIKASYRADKNSPWSYCWTGFYANPDDVKLILPDALQDVIYPAFDTFEIWNIILHFFQQEFSFDDYSEKEFATDKYHLEINYDCSRSFSMSSVLYQILSCLPLQKQKETTVSTNIKRIREYLDHSFNKPVQIAEVARLFSIHPTYLSAMFRKEYQISPKGYIIQKRIETAAQLLHTTDLTIKQISASVGYANQMEFAQLFKKHTGKSPTEYRQSSNRAAQ